MIRIALSLGFLGLLAGAESRQIAVIAHRGEHLSHRENTIEAFRAAFEAGADFFECDVRTTSDGGLVLVHDAKIAGREVSRMTLGEARQAGLATFDEALEFARGRIGVYVDSKAVSPLAAAAVIDRHGMKEGVVIYGALDYLKEISGRLPGVKVMPEAGNPEKLRALIRDLNLEVAAFDSRDFDTATIRVALAANVRIFVDRLGPADNPAAWQEAIDRGAAAIQTDRPAELVAYLRSKGMH